MCECMKNGKEVVNGKGIRYWVYWCYCENQWCVFKIPGQSSNE